jgi:ferritin-like protein
MPTQEKWLTILEYDLKQYKTETIKAYGEMAIEMIMVKGLMEDAVKRLASLKTEIEQRFVRVDTRLDAIDADLENIDTRLGQMENMLAQILARLPEKP